MATKQEMFLSDIDNKDFVNLREKYSELQTNNALDNGIKLKAQNEKIQKFYNEFVNEIDLLGFMWNMRNYSKLEGAMFASLADTPDGSIKFDIAFPYSNNKLATVYDEGKIAKLYKKPINDDKGTIIVEEWDTMKVVRYGMYKGERVDLDNLYLKEGEAIKPVWEHNLGFLPVWVMKGRPNTVFHIGADGRYIYSKSAFDNHVSNLDELYNFNERLGVKSDIMTIPRLLGKLDPSTILRLQKAGGELALIAQQVLIGSNKVDTNGQGAPIELIQATLEQATRDTHLENVEKRYARGCGSSYVPDGNTVATATETFYSNSLDEKTANKDIKQIENFLYKIFDALFIHANLMKPTTEAEREYTFEVLGNKVLSDIDKTDMVIKQMDAGIMTLEEALVELKNLTTEEAAQRVKELEEQKAKEYEKQMALMTAFDTGEKEPNEKPEEE